MSQKPKQQPQQQNHQKQGFDRQYWTVPPGTLLEIPTEVIVSTIYIHIHSHSHICIFHPLSEPNL